MFASSEVKKLNLIGFLQRNAPPGGNKLKKKVALRDLFGIKGKMNEGGLFGLSSVFT